jgi:hypothetical protein
MRIVKLARPIRQYLSKAEQLDRYLVSLAGAVLLCALGMRIYISQTSGLMYDEPVTLHLAKAVASGQLPFRDFYEHHSLLPWYLLAPLSNTSLWRVQRLLVALAGVLAITGLYRLSSSVWGTRAGLLAVVLGAVSPLWQHQGTMIIHDSILVVALVGALMIWWCALQQDALSLWLLAGICAGLVVHSKQTGMLSVLALGIGTLVFTRSAKTVAAYLVGASLTLTPLVFLYGGHFDLLYQGLMGWNLAANAYLPPNPKFKPFFNDIFLANPVLWGVGGLAALLALGKLRHRAKPGDSSPLLAVAGLMVIFTLIFNWFLSKQTFNQYYLQVVPPLILLTAWALNALVDRPLSRVSKVGAGLLLVYLGVVNPLVNALVPWTPDLQEKLQIADWVREEVDDEAIWEPWVYYAHLAEKEFSFFYPFLSIHSMRDDPELLTIDGRGNIELDAFLESNHIRWVVVHHPLMLGLETYLDRKFTAGLEDWQLVRSFQVSRYASESGMQHRFWTPWWRPLVFYETVSVWYRHPGERQGGLIGELSIHNPTELPNLYLKVQHRGGTDVYQLDHKSNKGRDYSLNWHQTGHAFFLSEGPLQIDHRTGSDDPDQLVLTIGFSDRAEENAQKVYQVRIPRVVEAEEYCSDCVETWECQSWGAGVNACERKNIADVIEVSAVPYKPVEGVIIENRSPEE